MISPSARFTDCVSRAASDYLEDLRRALDRPWVGLVLSELSKQPVTLLEIIETEAMETGMVTVNAEATPGCASQNRAKASRRAVRGIMGL